jgi:hypothetical protein
MISTAGSTHNSTPAISPTSPLVSTHIPSINVESDLTMGVLTTEEMQKLSELNEELGKSEPSLGVLAMHTEDWFRFTPLLQDKFRAAITSTASLNAELIEPKVGDIVDATTMRHGLLPRNYQKRVRAVKSLGFKLPSGGGVKPMVEIE